MLKKITLSNGLRMIAIPQKTAQAVTVLVLVKTGSKYESKEKNGISHFLEHLFFKGTKTRPSPIEVAETLDQVGGIFNAFTSEEYTGYYAKVAASQFGLALDWVSDIYLNSLLKPQDVAREKGVIIEEINMRFDHPSDFVQILWSELLYGDQPAGWHIAGTKESVSNITQKDLLDYRSSQYVANDTLVCVAGGVSATSAVAAVKRHFSRLAFGQSQDKPKVVENQLAPACLVRQKDTDQTHLCFGARSYNMFHRQRYAQDILAAILGGMMSSRLFIEVREKLGAAYYISTHIDSDTDTGCLVTQAGVDNKNVFKVVSTILKEYKKIARTKVSREELKKAKECLKGRTALLLESSDALAYFYGIQELLRKEILTAEQIYDKIDKVSSADIQKAARDIFQPQNLNLALVGPFEDKKPFERLLRA